MIVIKYGMIYILLWDMRRKGNYMNIKQIKEKIKDLPDDMLVCGRGHYGEILPIFFVHVTEVGEGHFGEGKKCQACVISIEDAGPEPD